jgi:ribose transport system permease protein
LKVLDFFKNRDYLSYVNVYFIFLAFFIGFAIFVPHFFSVGNLFNFVRQAAIPVILAVGMTLLLISGDFDLSIEGQVAVIAMICAKFINHLGFNPVWAIIFAPLIGIAFGLFNGVLSIRIPSFIVTLGTLVITRGIALIINNSQSIANFPDLIKILARAEVFKIPILVIYVVIIVIIALILTKKMRFGRQIYAMGGDRITTRSFGIPVNRNTMILFTLMGFLCGICALMLMGKVNAAHPLSMEGQSLDTVTAVILGGTSLYGGSGGIFGSVVGASFIVMLSIVFNLMGISSAWKRVILGLALIIVVLLDYTRKRKYERGIRT